MANPRQCRSGAIRGGGKPVQPGRVPRPYPISSRPDASADLAASRLIAHPHPEAAVAHEHYRRLAMNHVRELAAPFHRLSHLRLNAVWIAEGSPSLPAASALCRNGGCPGGCSHAGRENCLRAHLELALHAGNNGHRFTCRRGMQNYWLPINILDHPVGFLFIQARRRSMPGPGNGRSTPAASPLAAPPSRPVTVSRDQFAVSARILQLILRHVETSALADLRGEDLARAQHAVLELRQVTTRLRTELNNVLPTLHKVAPVLEPETHTGQLVHAALDYIHQGYSRPLTLGQCAAQFHLNPAYLSFQFSRTVGIPFKRYLTEVRLEHARELLGQPAMSIAEVAYAVGYTSENRFRVAFKSATGLPPRLWRETLRLTRA